MAHQVKPKIYIEIIMNRQNKRFLIEFIAKFNFKLPDMIKSIHLMAFLSICVGLKAFFLVEPVSSYLLEEERTYEGYVVKYLDENKVYLISETEELIELQFAHDKSAGLSVDDLGKVKVHGYYSRIHQVLLVEDIFTQNETISAPIALKE